MNRRNGISIGIERINNDCFLSIKAVGKLTHEDYEKITPMIDSALGSLKDAAVKVFFDTSEFDGWELRAAWDDFKLGLKHGNSFTRVAVLGNRKWLELASKIGAWFIAGEVKYFRDRNAAIRWLQTDS
jgi:hypothetical protein